jgi:hypothetical protein
MVASRRITRIALGGGHDLRLERDDRAVQRRDVAEQGAQGRPQQHRDRRIVGRNERAQFGKSAAARGGDNAELGELAAPTVPQLRALLDQQLAGPLDAARRLLLDALDRDKAHVRPPQCSTDRPDGSCPWAEGPRIAGIVLVALDKRLDTA